MRSSFDTNIAIYALAEVSKVDKTHIARQLLTQLRSTGEGVISTQVLKEFANVCTRKLRPQVSEAALMAHLEALGAFDLVLVDAYLTTRAVRQHYVSHTSFYDSLIVEAAIAGGAKILYSEDLQHGMRFGALRVVNPFL